MTIPISTSCSKSKCLLDDLAAKCGCLYLSDLVYTVQDHCIKSALRAITPENYTMKEWIDAIEYLTRAPQPPFVSQLEAAQYLFSIPFYYKSIIKIIQQRSFETFPLTVRQKGFV